MSQETEANAAKVCRLVFACPSSLLSPVSCLLSPPPPTQQKSPGHFRDRGFFIGGWDSDYCPKKFVASVSSTGRPSWSLVMLVLKRTSPPLMALTVTL